MLDRVKIPKEYLIENYIGRKKTINQIASAFNCSQKCIWTRIKRYGLPIIKSKPVKSARHRTGREMKFFQREIGKLYGGKCAVCGYEKFTHAHHINPFSKSTNNTVENGILLCPNHHAEADYGLITQEQLKQYQVKKT